MANIEELTMICKEIEDNNIKPQNFQLEFEHYVKSMNYKILILDIIVFSSLFIHIFSSYYNFNTLAMALIMILQLSYIDDRGTRRFSTHNYYHYFVSSYRREFADTFVYKDYTIEAVLHRDEDQFYFIRDVTFNKDDSVINATILRDYNTQDGYNLRTFMLKLKSN